MMSTVPASLSWPMTNFAKRLRDLRSARKLTQTRLAELLQVSPRVYSRKESQSPPKIRNHEPHRIYQKVDLLSGDDKKALLAVLDSLVKRSHISRVMAA